MTQPLWYRLYFQPAMYEVARAVGYTGTAPDDLRKRLKSLAKTYGDGKIALAVSELTQTDEKTKRTVLRSHVRALCWQLLGPPPEKLEEFKRPSVPPSSPYDSGEPDRPSAERPKRARKKN
jgi:hypothetical protein